MRIGHDQLDVVRAGEQIGVHGAPRRRERRQVAEGPLVGDDVVVGISRGVGELEGQTDGGRGVRRRVAGRRRATRVGRTRVAIVVDPVADHLLVARVDRRVCIVAIGVRVVAVAVGVRRHCIHGPLVRVRPAPRRPVGRNQPNDVGARDGRRVDERVARRADHVLGVDLPLVGDRVAFGIRRRNRERRRRADVGMQGPCRRERVDRRWVGDVRRRQERVADACVSVRIGDLQAEHVLALVRRCEVRDVAGGIVEVAVAVEVPLVAHDRRAVGNRAVALDRLRGTLGHRVGAARLRLGRRD